MPVPSSGAADGGALAVAEVRLHVEPAERQREADEEEADEAEAEDGEVRAHDVGRVLGPAEAGLDEREAGLHEDHQDRPDDHPQQVEVAAEDADGRHRVVLLGEGDAAGEQRDERRARNPPITYFSARLFRIISPWFEVRGPGRPARGDPSAQLRGTARFWQQHRHVSALLRSVRRRTPLSDADQMPRARRRRRAGEHGSVPASIARSSSLRPSRSVEREAVDQLAVDARHAGAVHDDAGGGESASERSERARAVATGDRARRVPRRRGVVELHVEVRQRTRRSQRCRRVTSPSGRRASLARGRTAERTRNVSTTAPSGHVATVAAAMSQPAECERVARDGPAGRRRSRQATSTSQ